MSHLLDLSLACESSISSTGEQEHGSSSGLGEEVFSSGLNCPGVVVLSHKGDNGKGIYLKAHSGE